MNTEADPVHSPVEAQTAQLEFESTQLPNPTGAAGADT